MRACAVPRQAHEVAAVAVLFPVGEAADRADPSSPTTTGPGSPNTGRGPSPDIPSRPPAGPAVAQRCSPWAGPPWWRWSTGHRRNLEQVQGLVTSAQWGNFRFLEADIRDAGDCRHACEGVEHVLHQAALGSVPRSVAGDERGADAPKPSVKRIYERNDADKFSGRTEPGALF